MLHDATVFHTLRLIPSPTRHLSTALRQFLISLLIGASLTALFATQTCAETDPIQAPLAKGIILLSHPSMDDPNFRHTVVLIIEHGPKGSVGLVLNRPTNILLSQTLPDLAVLKGTAYRLFIGGPVSPNRMTMLVRLKEPQSGVTSVFDGVYVGGSPDMLQRLISQPQPTEAFRVFAGVAGWAPDQLAFEVQQGAWATLPADAAEIFEKDPTSLWPDSLKRLQAPMVISNEKDRLSHTRNGSGHQSRLTSVH